MTNNPCSNLAVLVVDDNEMFREIVSATLAKMGFGRIDFATTSAEAQKKISPEAYDIICLDWVMPGKSGYTLMQEYRQDRAYDHVAFIMVTNQSDERHMIEAQKAGATCYIVKTSSPAHFRAKIETALEWLKKVSPRFKSPA